jgi:hypothetical protein
MGYFGDANRCIASGINLKLCGGNAFDVNVEHMERFNWNKVLIGGSNKV